MLYVISDGQFLKIGISSDVQKRIAALQVGSAQQLTLIACFKCRDDVYAERLVHQELTSYLKRGEWFDLGIREALQKIIDLKIIDGMTEPKQTEFPLSSSVKEDKQFTQYMELIGYTTLEFYRCNDAYLDQVEWNEMIENHWKEFHSKRSLFDSLESMANEYNRNKKEQGQKRYQRFRELLRDE